MRSAFVDTLIESAEKDRDIMLLTGDLGFSVLEKFRDNFPSRFLNMGVAEQNMIGVAAGLALSGKIVFVYSIIPFLTMRCYEHIRNDICFQNLSVRLVGVGAGLAYGSAGVTHHALEDVSIMRSLVNMTVLAPGDVSETEMAVRESIYRPGPVYIRLGKGRGSAVHQTRPYFKIGKGIVIREGRDITIMASGTMLFTAHEVWEELRNKGVSATLISMPTVKPLDERLVMNSARRTNIIFTIEEHSEIGGLGSAVAEVLAESGLMAKLKIFAVKDRCQKTVGSHEYMLRANGLSKEAITKGILKSIDRT